MATIQDWFAQNPQRVNNAQQVDFANSPWFSTYGQQANYEGNAPTLGAGTGEDYFNWDTLPGQDFFSRNQQHTDNDNPLSFNMQGMQDYLNRNGYRMMESNAPGQMLRWVQDANGNLVGDGPQNYYTNDEDVGVLGALALGGVGAYASSLGVGAGAAAGEAGGLSGMDLAADAAAGSGNSIGTAAGAFGGGEAGAAASPFEYATQQPDWSFQNIGADTGASGGSSVADTQPWSDARFAGSGYGGAGADAASGNWYDSLLNGLGNAGSKFAGNFGNTLGNVGGNMLTAALLQKMFGPKQPATPDFNAIADKQGAANLQAAQINNQMNRVDTTTPFGYQKFNTTADPTVPGGYRYSQTIGFSPEQQKLYDTMTANQQAKADTATGMQQQIKDAVASPFSLSSLGPAPSALSTDPNAFSSDRDAVTKAVYDRLTSLRKPQMDAEREAMDTKLKNQGLMPGTVAYDRAMKNLMDSHASELENAANQAVITGGTEQSRLMGDLRSNTATNQNLRQQGLTELLTGRNQPLQEYNAYMNGTTPTMPSFQAFGYSNSQAPNYQQAGASQYGANADSYNNQIAQFQALLNFGTGMQKTPAITWGG